LYALKLAADPVLSIADKLLMTPDLLAYFLTGKMATEYTIASTSQLIDPIKRDWAWDLMDAFGIRERCSPGSSNPARCAAHCFPRSPKRPARARVP
jgi:rhamnulokinase